MRYVFTWIELRPPASATPRVLTLALRRGPGVAANFRDDWSGVVRPANADSDTSSRTLYERTRRTQARARARGRQMEAR